MWYVKLFVYIAIASASVKCGTVDIDAVSWCYYEYGSHQCEVRDLQVPSRETKLISSTGYMTRVYNFKLTSDDFRFIPSQFFTQFNISYLTLHTNNLQEIEESDFLYGSALVKLTIGSSSITKLPANVFRQLSGLKGLVIDNSPIETIDQAALNGLSKLEVFTMKNTRVQTLHPEIFAPLISIYKIDVIKNGIRSLHPNLFANKPHLAIIVIHEKITDFDEQLFAQKNLRMLELVYDGKRDSDRAILHLHLRANETKYLVIQNYYLDEVTFENSQIRKLELTNVRINAQSMKHLDNLENLGITRSYNNNANNTLAIDSELFGDLRNVHSISIENCNIVNVECDAFAGNKKLNQLSIYNSFAAEAVKLDPKPCILGRNAPLLESLTIGPVSRRYGREYKVVAPKLIEINLLT